MPRLQNNKFSCLTSTQVQNLGGKVITNIDGSVSLYIPQNSVLSPVKLSKECCLKLNATYTFDENTQKCMWGTPPNCVTNDSYKLTLNPIGNDGAIFNVGNDETCSLNIEFDYLFKVSCAALTNMAGSPTSFVSSEVRGQINQLQNQIADQTVLCETLSGQIDILQQQIDETPYSIVCNSEYSTPESLSAIPSSTIEANTNTGFGDLATQTTVDGTGKEYGSTPNQNVGTYCLTSAGLSAFQTILGTGYTYFINGYPNSYTCDDVDALILQDNSTNDLVYPCEVTFGTKNVMMANMTILEQQLEECNSTLATLTTELNELTTNTPTIVSNCAEPINFFETLDVSMTLDVFENNQTTSVYEAYDVFPAIGNGNLYGYLTAHTNSGFYVYDEASGKALDFNTNINSCFSIPSNLLSSLGVSKASDLPISAFTSSWLHYSTTITDPDIIALIADKKIKISLKVNNTCTNMCVLLDNIKLNKECDKVTKTNIFVTECPGFDLDRIRDNKKSWINNTMLVNRDFEILNAKGVKPIRQTNYNTEDERLVLNSKEIDLDINLAAAIETDVWCYISDNPCLLTGASNCVFYSAITTTGCPQGFTATTTGCQKITYTSATVNISTYTATTGSKNTAYGSAGAYVFGDITNVVFPITAQTSNILKDANGNTLSYTTTGTNQLWGNGSTLYGRLNNVGIWTTNAPNPVGEWIGFSFCVDLPNSQTYTIGYGVDDAGKIYIDGELVIDLESGYNFNPWYLFPITLSAGTHIIEMFGYNAGGAASMGAEIYSADTSVISGFTATTQLTPYIAFSTGSYTGQTWQIGQNSGYSCPNGYALDTCGPTVGCVNIQNTPFTGITGTTAVDGSCVPFYCCGDNRIDFNSLFTQPLSAVTVVEDFEYYLTSELIDAKSRQTISAYPTLRALYDRYMSSSAYCATNSSAFDYNTMDKFAGLVGDYWVDIVEQVIPATTIWGSVKVYSNTIFDTQKFKYKAYTSFFCDDSFSGETVPSPINGTSGLSQTVGVDIESITTGYTGNIGTGCNEIRIVQLNYGSEFIGQVSELNVTGANVGSSKSNLIKAE